MIAVAISSGVKSLHKFVSADENVPCLIRLTVYFPRKRFVRGPNPTVTQQARRNCIRAYGMAEVFLRLMSLLRFDPTFRIECFMSIFLTVAIHCSFHLEFKCSIRRFDTKSFSSGVCASSSWKKVQHMFRPISVYTSFESLLVFLPSLH